MTYLQPSRGVTLHLRYIHYDLNPTSKTYWRQHIDLLDEPDEDSRYVVGAQRTPSHRRERQVFLWRFMELNVKDVVGSPALTCQAIWKAASREVFRMEQIMKVAGDTFTPMIRNHAEVCLSNDEITTELDSYPVYFQTTLTYFQLACKRPYMTQIQLLTTCTAQTDHRLAISIVSRLLRLIGADQARKYDDYKPLDQAVAEARRYKHQANKFAQKESWRLAIMWYTHAILALLPWFPSEYYMAPWEARLNGVGGLLVKCNINLAISIAAFFNDHHLAYVLLDHTASLACVTNWEMAKIAHLQATYAKEIRLGQPCYPKSTIKRPALDIQPLSVLYQRREAHLNRPRDALAIKPWIGSFSPEDLRQHHLQLSARIIYPQEGWWWENEDSEEASRMRQWNGHVGYLFWRHCETWERLAKEESDDLAERNRGLALKIKLEQMDLEEKENMTATDRQALEIYNLYEHGDGYAIERT